MVLFGVFKRGLTMEELKAYLNSLTTKEQESFALRCNTTVGYLRKSISRNSRLGAEICVAIERETKGLVTRKHLIEDWHLRWPELANDKQ